MSGSTKSDNLKGLRILQEVHPTSRKIYSGQFFHRTSVQKSEEIQKLAHFADCIHHGILPDGEVMAWMADAIKTYLDGKKLTMDSALSLKPSTKAGNPAKQYAEECQLSEMFVTMLLYIIDNKISQREAAENTLKLYDVDTDVEAFLKTFRRRTPNRKVLIQTLRQNRESFPKITDK